MSPTTWVNQLYLYGPMALFVFMVFVLLGKASKSGGLSPAQRRTQNVAFICVWVSIFALGLVITGAWWRLNLPAEYEIKGMIHDLQDPATISTNDNLFLRRIYKTAFDISYEFRILSSSPVREPVGFLLQENPKEAGFIQYEIPVSDNLYKGPVEISFDAKTKIMKLTDGSYTETLKPTIHKIAAVPPSVNNEGRIVYAATGSPTDLVRALDSNDPIIRQNAKRDLIALGRNASSYLVDALYDQNSSSRLKAEALATLEGVVGTSEIKTSASNPIEISASGLGVFVLGQSGDVARVSFDTAGPHLENELKLQGAFRAVSISATTSSVYIAAVTTIGCTVFRYTPPSTTLTSKVLPAFQCTSIASDGDALYVGGVTADGSRDNEVRYVRNWNSQGVAFWSEPNTAIGALHYDSVGNRLLIGDSLNGKLYVASRSHTAKSTAAEHLGWINSLTSGDSRILVASGKKVLFLDRATGSGLSPPKAFESFKGGHISGVALDVAGNVWVADYDRRVVIGPIAIN